MVDAPPIRIEVPICAFRPYASREYQDTFPIPTPATIYGMLLSLVGEPPAQSTDNRVRHQAKEKHRGAEMAIGIARLPARSKVFRKLRRGADLEDIRPDYQDLLMDLTLWIWLRKGLDSADPPLAVRVVNALEAPESTSRWGGLSLGESSYLVDVVRIDPSPPERLTFVAPDAKGFYSLPVWVDHVNNKRIYERSSIRDSLAVEEALATSWFRIGGT